MVCDKCNICLIQSLYHYFRYLCELTHHALKGESLQKSVTVVGDDTGFKLNFNLPEYGEYGVNVYASKHIESQRLHHVYTYFIQYRTSDAGPSKKSQKTMKTNFKFVEEDRVDLELPLTIKRNATTQLRRKHVRSKNIKSKQVEIR